MKKSILVLTTAFFLFAGTTMVLTSCGSDDNTEQHEHTDGDMHNDGDMNSDSEMMNHSDGNMDMDTTNAAADSDSTDVVYACPMHHNITGKKGDTCSICGMKLTNTETDKAHKGHTHMHND